MVFNATFNNISVYLLAVSCSVGGNRNTQGKTTDKLYNLMLYPSPASMGFELTMLVVIGTDCIGSYKSNYHTITATVIMLSTINNITYYIAVE